jgi:predicted amidohydrolase
MHSGLGEYEGEEVIDAEGQMIVPGFIDGHVHIESSMVCRNPFLVKYIHDFSVFNDGIGFLSAGWCIQPFSLFNQEWISADIAITGGVIVGLGEYEGEEVIDAEGSGNVRNFVRISNDSSHSVWEDGFSKFNRSNHRGKRRRWTSVSCFLPVFPPLALNAQEPY